MGDGNFNEMWSLSPDIHHLNHGSFGAVPVPIQESQTEWRRRWETNPTGFVYNELSPGLERSRDALAQFLGADRDGLAFVRNASHGVAAVARSVESWLGPGGWPALMKRNRELALGARDVVCDQLGLPHGAPDEMVGSMASIPLPDFEGPDPGGLLSPLNKSLIDQGFESMVMLWRHYPKQILRLSAHHYNDLNEYELLADKISEMRN